MVEENSGAVVEENLSSTCSIGDVSAGADPAAVALPSPNDLAIYDQTFFTRSNEGYIDGNTAREIFTASRLPDDVLGAIWSLSDMDMDSQLSHREFRVAMHLAMQAFRHHVPVPAVVPPAVLSALAERLPMGQPTDPVAGCHHGTSCLLGPLAAATLDGGGIHREPNFLPPQLLAALRQDVDELLQEGSFRQGESHRGNGERDGLRSALRCSYGAKRSDAFWQLHARLSELRAELSHRMGRGLARGFEAAFVVYPPGGFYHKHLDSAEGVDPGGTGRRRFSFICYLNEPGWQASDGGALRIYQGNDEPPQELLPEGGMLAVFDSKRVWHEVAPTSRERSCVVGWFLEDED